MSARHLSCEGGRIRARAHAADVELLHGRCPVCGEGAIELVPVGFVGSRSPDLEVLAEGPGDRLPPVPAQSLKLAANRATASSRDHLDADADRWSDDGGSIARRPHRNDGRRTHHR
jgi:hypothetical protein